MVEQNISISVVIPFFGPQNLQLINTIQSVLNQGNTNYEIVVVDDGSDPPLILSEEIFNNSKIKIIRHDRNKGPGVARNTGIRSASFEWIAFLDSDDLWFQNKLQTQQAYLQALSCDNSLRHVAISCGFYLTSAITSRRKQLLPKSSNNPLDFASGVWFCPGSTILIHRSVFDRIGGYDSTLRRYEDLDWFLRFALAGGRLVAVPEILTEIIPSGKPNPQLALEAAENMERFSSVP